MPPRATWNCRARALHQAEVNLGYTTITSPIDGTVISRNIDVGQTVASAFQAPTLFLIAQDLRRMQVDTSVSEADVGRLKTGMATTFSVDAYPGESFSGRVRQIRSSPTTVQNVVTYDAVIDVDNSSLKLKPGMTANVSFVTAERPSVVRVPNAALRFEPDDKLLKQIGIEARAPARAVCFEGGMGAARQSSCARAHRVWDLRWHRDGSRARKRSRRRDVDY